MLRTTAAVWGSDGNTAFVRSWESTMMKMPRRMFACSLLLMLVGCGQSEEVPPPSTSELGSALPRPVADDGEADCAEPVRQEDERGNEPSMSAWVQVADAIFVGTVDATARVESPVHHRKDGKDLGPGDATQCEYINYAMTVTFRDVESLYGEALPASFTMQMGAFRAGNYPGAYVDESGQLHDAFGSRVYPPGARVGAALFKDSDGAYHWQYRQFEVVDGVVHLQLLDDSRHYCSTVPTVTHIPDEFDGVAFEEFKDAITHAATVALTEEETHSIAERHGFHTIIDWQQFKDDSQTYCYLPVERDVDPANNRDESL